MTTPSKQALGRAKRFVKAKAEAGSYAELVAQKQRQKILVYFDYQGNIHGISRQEIPDFPFKSYAFAQDQLEIMKGKSSDQFLVKQDKKHSDIYHLEARPVEQPFTRTDDMFLSEVKYGEDKDYEVRVEVLKDALVVTLHTEVMRDYLAIPLEKVTTAKGQKMLRFYFTAKSDPHFMIHCAEVSVEKLVENKQVKVELDTDLRQCSVFTPKAFDKYLRV